MKMLTELLKYVLIYVALYPCAKGHVHRFNRTTNAIESKVQLFLGEGVVAVLVDAVLFSANTKRTNGKTFNADLIPKILGDDSSLLRDLYCRLCHQFRAWAELFSGVFKFPV